MCLPVHERYTVRTIKQVVVCLACCMFVYKLLHVYIKYKPYRDSHRHQFDPSRRGVSAD